jgi:FkbM family methyltransferase
MAKYDVEIHGFDPTPESADWIRQQTLPPSFQHHPVAIGGYDGEMIFELPQAVGQCARAIDPNSPPAGKTTAVPCKKLSSIAAVLGHKRIALLKMDIEGSENGDIEDLLNKTLKVDQILVEFHHWFPVLECRRRLMPPPH